MRKQALVIAGLGLLLTQGVLWSQEAAVSQEMTLRIMTLKYYAVQEMSRILETIYGGERTQIVVDEKTNCLVVRATADRMVEIERLVSELDRETESVPESQSLLCRVYMVELPLNLKPFTAVLKPASDVDFSHLRKAAEGRTDFHIDRIGFSRRNPNGKESISIYYWSDYNGGGPDAERLDIYGQAASEEVVKQMLRLVPDTQMADIRWDNKTPDVVVPAAEVNQLPEQLRQHIHRFLGAEAQTVGYWFGNMSSPGQIKAPIGPWSIELKVKPAQANGLSIEVGVMEWRNDSNWSILENSIQGKAGKPILIGYNRELNGTRTMGAMIILLEADAAPGGLSQTKAP